MISHNFSEKQGRAVTAVAVVTEQGVQALGASQLLKGLRDLAHQGSMARLAAEYLATEVYGVRSPHTLEAKSRDLAAFIRWFIAINSHGDIRGWRTRDTNSFLRALEEEGRAPATCNRTLATLRGFARWAHELPQEVFGPGGLPTREATALAIDEPDCKKLSTREMHALFKAADDLTLTSTRKNARPWRNRAILAVLYYTGLRVSELVGLRRDQYDGRYFLGVRRKGKVRTAKVYIPSGCRAALDAYLERERPGDLAVSGLPELTSGLVLPTRGGDFMTRRMVGVVLTYLATEANKHRGEKGFSIYPHRLRHTFGAEYRDRTGSDTETARALGHTGLQYVGRYVRRTEEEREAVLEGFCKKTKSAVP